MYIDESGTTYANHDAVRRSLKHVSLPRVLTDEILARFGIRPLEVEPDPETAPTEVVDEELRLVNGVWVKVKVKREATPEELAAKTEAKVAAVKERIDRILAETDWTQLLDTPTAKQQSFAAYRALVRDVKKQAGYPFDITWPVRP